MSDFIQIVITKTRTGLYKICYMSPKEIVDTAYWINKPDVITELEDMLRHLRAPTPDEIQS